MKPRYELIPPECIEALAAHLTKASGAPAGDLWAWKSNPYPWSYRFGSVMRHAWCWMKGDKYDQDGNHHLLAAAWWCLVLYFYELKGIGQDDRNSSATEKGQTKTAPKEQNFQRPCDTEVPSTSRVIYQATPEASVYAHYYGVHK